VLVPCAEPAEVNEMPVSYTPEHICGFRFQEVVYRDDKFSEIKLLRSPRQYYISLLKLIKKHHVAVCQILYLIVNKKRT